MKQHILNTISPYFLFEFNISNLLHLKSFLALEEENYIFSPSPRELINTIFFMVTIHLQLPHIYFTMAKKKFTKMVTPNTLETMIEYTLISSILNKICEMTTKPLEYPKNLTRLNPLKNLLKVKT